MRWCKYMHRKRFGDSVIGYAPLEALDSGIRIESRKINVLRANTNSVGTWNRIEFWVVVDDRDHVRCLRLSDSKSLAENLIKVRKNGNN